MPFIFKNIINNVEQERELSAALLRGNHKSAHRGPEQLLKLITQDVHHGFSLPMLRETAHLIKGGAAQPLGLVTQWTLPADGLRVQKSRMTQDLSFAPIKPLNAINKRIDIDAYPEIVYGKSVSTIFQSVLK